MQPAPSEGSVRPIPLRIGSPEQFRALRDALIQMQFDEKSISRRIGIESIFQFTAKSDGRQTGTELNDALDALIHLLIDGEPLPADRLRSLLPPAHAEALEALGVIAPVPGQPDVYYSTVYLYPVAALYAASDRHMTIDGADATTLPDIVYPAITNNTKDFLSCLPSSPCERLLDLCSGTGIAALIAARYAGQAWSCDLAERSVRFADFNRRLNGIENVICAQGDLYEPVGDLTFDRIVAHPPCIPAAEQKVLFRDGGEDGEQVLRRIVQGLPDHLSPGGRCYCVTMASDRAGENLEQRIRGWLGDRQAEFDVMLVGLHIVTKQEFLRGALTLGKDHAQNAQAIGELLDRLKVTGIYYGAIVIQRIANGRSAVTARTRKASRAESEAVEWFVSWAAISTGPEFDEFVLASRPHPSAGLKLYVTHQVENGRLAVRKFELETEFPFVFKVGCPVPLAKTAEACDGKKTIREIFEDLARRDVIDKTLTAEQFLEGIRGLIYCGFLELDEFPLPVAPVD